MLILPGFTRRLRHVFALVTAKKIRRKEKKWSSKGREVMGSVEGLSCSRKVKKQLGGQRRNIGKVIGFCWKCSHNQNTRQTFYPHTSKFIRPAALHPLFPSHPSYIKKKHNKKTHKSFLPLPASRAKFPICQFNSLIDGKEQEKTAQHSWFPKLALAGYRRPRWRRPNAMFVKRREHKSIVI